MRQMIFTEEVLYHFNCSNCNAYWSMSDTIVVTGDIFYCPVCGVKQMANKTKAYDEEGNIDLNNNGEDNGC